MEILSNYIVPVIVGLCLVVGFLIKHVTSADNRFIPIVVTVLGVALVKLIESNRGMRRIFLDE